MPRIRVYSLPRKTTAAKIARMDVAVSFLREDEPIAMEIYNNLSEYLRVFVYSKRQEELAGTDGLESFRKVFLSDSKLVVILYRDGCGKTRWTAVEELAIKERIFNGAWDSLMVVMLDENNKPPAWIPGTHIRLNYANYREALTGAIKMRAQELGSAFKQETLLERAQRAEASDSVRTERDRELRERGGDALRTEHQTLRKQLDMKVSKVQSQLTTIKLETGADGRTYVMRSEEAAISVYLRDGYPVTTARIVVDEFDGPVILPGIRRMFIPGEAPHRISTDEFFFDYQPSHGWCWRKRTSKSQFRTTPDLADYLIKRLFELHEDFKSGKNFRHGETDDDDGSEG